MAKAVKECLENCASKNSLSAAELAYLGDAVFELWVRKMLIKKGVPFRDLNSNARGYVCAVAQAKMYHRLYPLLLEKEQAIIKRGRNLHNTSRAKGAQVAEYRHATGLETLFGYLYNMGDIQRIDEIFALCVSEEK